MTKEEYEKIQVNQDFPLSLIYEYYNDVKPINYINLTYDEFSKFFSIFLFNGLNKPILTLKGMKIVSYESIIDKVYTYFNEKFKL